MRADDDEGVEPFDGRFVREPERQDHIAGLRVMTSGKGEEMGQPGLEVVQVLSSGVEIASCPAMGGWETGVEKWRDKRGALGRDQSRRKELKPIH